MRQVKNAYALVRRSFKQFFEDDCTELAAAISYYALFSIFPLLIFIVAMLGLFFGDSDFQKDVIEAVQESLPLSQDGEEDIAEAVETVTGRASGALGVFGVIGTAWSASNLFGALRRSLNVVFDVEGKRPFLKRKLLDLGLVLGAGLFFLASILTTALLRSARELSEDIPVLGDAAEEAGFAWDAISYIVPFAFSLIAFTFLYRVLPGKKITLREVWPGALIAAVAFEVAKVGFTFYLANFSNYDLVYGSLGAVIAFLFWIYLSATILLFGAEIAAQYSRLLQGDGNGAKNVGSIPVSERTGSSRP